MPVMPIAQQSFLIPWFTGLLTPATAKEIENTSDKNNYFHILDS